MIKVRTEDSKDGLVICQKIKELYFNEIEVNTLNGIVNLKKKVVSILNDMQADDILIIVYDNIVENVIVSNNINDLLDYIYKTNERRVKMIPTISFELEILTINNIELLYNFDVYKEWFSKLRELYTETRDIRTLTQASKHDKKYSEMYDSVRREKKRSRYYKVLSEKEFEDSITIESISKKIISRIFDLSEIRPVRECWVNNCCYKNGECKITNIDTQSIKDKESIGNRLYKIRALINETAFKNVAIRIGEILHKELIINETIYDLVRNEVLVEMLELSKQDIEAMKVYKKLENEYDKYIKK
ncbi:MAG: hypothetical protein HFG78_14140 [Hungatella sp.]|nr:hypothetical protein [Hungatella sp.]MCI9500800.1 hypothetical protein [Hungatella sp.]